MEASKVYFTDFHVPVGTSQLVKLRRLIEDKIAGKEVVAAEAESHSNVIDLMDALKASIEQAKPQKPRRTRKPGA